MLSLFFKNLIRHFTIKLEPRLVERNFYLCLFISLSVVVLKLPLSKRWIAFMIDSCCKHYLLPKSYVNKIYIFLNEFIYFLWFCPYPDFTQFILVLEIFVKTEKDKSTVIQTKTVCLTLQALFSFSDFYNSHLTTASKHKGTWHFHAVVIHLLKGNCSETECLLCVHYFFRTTSCLGCYLKGLSCH